MIRRKIDDWLLLAELATLAAIRVCDYTPTGTTATRWRW